MVRRIVYGAQGTARLVEGYKFMRFSHRSCVGEVTKLRMRDVVVNLPYITPFLYSTVKYEHPESIIAGFCKVVLSSYVVP